MFRNWTERVVMGQGDPVPSWQFLNCHPFGVLISRPRRHAKIRRIAAVRRSTELERGRRRCRRTVVDGGSLLSKEPKRWCGVFGGGGGRNRVDLMGFNFLNKFTWANCTENCRGKFPQFTPCCDICTQMQNPQSSMNRSSRRRSLPRLVIL